ncbi:MAG TPA: hypothetical protein VJP88_02245, partial [Caulobacteraceae bacterium]|nr:hypothetical protein [Caulobacteraceae bacterium]
VFEASYKHIQAVSGGVFINRPELGTLVIDQGGIKTKGVEGEFTLLPMRGLSFNGGFGYTDVRATSVNPIFGTLATYHPTLRPRWTTNIAAQYETEPLFRDARLVLRADASWRSTIRTFSQDVIPAPFRILTYSPASWIVNTRVAFKDIALARGHVEVALWAKNLNDNGAPVFPINFFFLGSTTYQSARTFGIDVIYDY